MKNSHVQVGWALILAAAAPASVQGDVRPTFKTIALCEAAYERERRQGMEYNARLAEAPALSQEEGYLIEKQNQHLGYASIIDSVCKEMRAADRPLGEQIAELTGVLEGLGPTGGSVTKPLAGAVRQNNLESVGKELANVGTQLDQSLDLLAGQLPIASGNLNNRIAKSAVAENPRSIDPRAPWEGAVAVVLADILNAVDSSLSEDRHRSEALIGRSQDVARQFQSASSRHTTERMGQIATEWPSPQRLRSLSSSNYPPSSNTVQMCHVGETDLRPFETGPEVCADRQKYSSALNSLREKVASCPNQQLAQYAKDVEQSISRFFTEQCGG